MTAATPLEATRRPPSRGGGARLAASILLALFASAAAHAAVDILAPMKPGYAVCKERPQGFQAVRLEGRSIRLVAAQFAYRPVASDTVVLDLFEFPEGAPPVCWILETPTDVPLLLRGLPANAKVDHFPQLQGEVRPGTDTRIETPAGSFAVRFPSLDAAMRAPGAERNVKSLRIASGNWECRLGGTAFFDGKAGFTIVLAADFNGDGLPDFVVENSPKGAFRNYEFLISERSRNSCRATGVRKQFFD